MQYRLLITGLQLQKTTLDRQVENILREVKSQLSFHNPISKDINRLTAFDKPLPFNEQDELKQKITKEFTARLKTEFEERGLESVEFTYAVSATGRSSIYFGSEHFADKHSRFSRYIKPLSGVVNNSCKCQLLLRLDVHNLFGYLLSQLRNLLIPSLLFLLLLAASFILLIRLLNQQNKLDQIKNDFINNLTHELKTPVFSISLAGKMLEAHLNNMATEKPKEYLRLIRSENEKIKGHIEKVLELASLENSKYVMEKAEVIADDFISEIATAFQAKIQLQNGRLVTDLEANNATIYIDKVHFKNALNNILENALKYAGESPPDVIIKTQKTNNDLFVKIKDKGKGINKEDQKHIFKKFYRVSRGNLHDVKGFGLGLSYVREVIKMHNGNITVESQINTGSEFIIKIPLK